MAKDFWRIESVDPVANMIVVQNLNGLVDRLRAAGEAFTITTDGAVAVEADETLIRKCAWSISSARVYAYRPRNANRQPQCQWSRYHVTEGRMVQASVLRAVMNGTSEAKPDPKDRRFADPAWKESFAYRALAQSYLAWAGLLNQFVDKAGMDKRDAERARFAFAPDLEEVFVAAF